MPGCPVVARGVVLRGACVGCGGTPRAPNAQSILRRGEALFHAGDPATHVFALIEGWVRVSVTTAEGRSCAGRLVGPGNVLGLEGLAADSERYRATATALRTARVCAVPLQEARARLRGHPDEALALTALCVQDLIALEQRLVANASMSAEVRIFQLVKELIGGAPRGTWSELPATREQLGEVLGLTCETVSRKLHRLAEKGLIALEGRRVLLLDAAACAPEHSSEA